MAASVAGRSRLVYALCRASKNSSSSSSFSAPRRFSVPLRPSNLVPRRSPISPPPLLRLVRRELCSLQPVHAAIASACLVSKLSSEVSPSAEGRFANYLSPI
ncbi:uncharacterized protein LOC132164202 [Corylus avellana]|uniref:uncharacterized protein LOC132164202 n=1 Tax=Corylus avellana TaxID=13451 RepID=UPI00286D10DE|nr:uncharacterized protein LOC132164202 [Corylus avellana]